jgi:energy-coupling factor transporter ATP-binding protein EcfA2
MRIDRIEFEGYKCFQKRVELRFPANFTNLIGVNGAGKTTVLRTIYRLAGPIVGAKYLQGYGGDGDFKKIEIDVSHEVRSYRLTLVDGDFDYDKIEDFKRTLPHRVSFPFGPDMQTMDVKFLSAVDISRTENMMRWIDREFGVARGMRPELRGLSVAPISSSSAFYTLLRLSRRMSGEHTPMLFDDMPGNVDYDKSRRLREFLVGENPNQQIICSSHSPAFVSPSLGEHADKSELVEVKAS